MQFGEIVHGYEVPVFNEREARAAAGILFLFAMISFMNALLIQNFAFLKVFIVAFFIEFFIRMFISPRHAPTMVLGRLMVKKQVPEYSGAPQKRFAWGIGLVMSFIMLILVVLLDVRGPVNFAFCVACLFFLFFEAVFGICVGCWMYNKFSTKKAKHCPGGACAAKFTLPIQQVNKGQLAVLIIFTGLMVLLVGSGVLGR